MNTIEKASGYAQEAAGRVSDISAQTSKAMSEKGEQMLKAQRKLMKRGRNYVSDHPMASIGIAAMIGLVLNRMFSYR
ncbi:DUF883 domain-containing protein [Candidatus Methylobacter oryzae]|uniref:DUF883 domain-containing protein n=1 Tax=Candidatus Methylobacter oryzae TaxID=2497749 RepID=A0ABY3C6N6_9GAMM|nr:DUF883 domain-containing protein [Candidatus Methylobacter oryzae]TRW91256.1 DUF883 domain-containing protein [Candidatus Methylobacter oryzae]